MIDALAGNESVKPAVEAVWSIGTALLVTVAVSAITFGILLVIAAWLAGPTRIATALRREAAPYLRERRGTTYAVVAFVFLVLVLWAPVAAFEKPIGLLLLAALMVLGTEVLRRQAEAEFPDATLRRARGPDAGIGSPTSGGGAVSSAAREQGRADRAALGPEGEGGAERGGVRGGEGRGSRSRVVTEGFNLGMGRRRATRWNISWKELKDRNRSARSSGALAIRHACGEEAIGDCPRRRQQLALVLDWLGPEWLRFEKHVRVPTREF